MQKKEKIKVHIAGFPMENGEQRCVRCRATISTRLTGLWRPGVLVSSDGRGNMSVVESISGARPCGLRGGF